jgi:hypothetical protein
MLERIVALAVVAVSGVYLTQALALPFGSSARPGAGFYPVAVAVLGCVVGVVAAARAFLVAPASARVARAVADDAAGRARALAATGILVVFCLLMPWVGYPVAALLFVFALLLRLGADWRMALVTAVAAAAVSHYLFAVLLDVPLPRGPW